MLVTLRRYASIQTVTQEKPLYISPPIYAKVVRATLASKNGSVVLVHQGDRPQRPGQFRKTNE